MVPKAQTWTRFGAIGVAAFVAALLGLLKVESGYLWPIMFLFLAPFLTIAIYVGFLRLGYGAKQQPVIQPKSMTIGYFFFAASAIVFALALFIMGPTNGFTILDAMVIGMLLLSQALNITGVLFAIRPRRTAPLQ